jgi:hypothetical protein
MYQSKLDAEIELREKERFEALEKQVEEAQKNFSAKEKKEFDSLWSFYCNNLDEIQNRTNQITRVRDEEAILAKDLTKKMYVFFLSAFVIYISNYFFSSDNNSIAIAILAIAIFFVSVKIKNDIQVASKNIEEKLHASAICDLRHTLSLRSMFNIKYEQEYIEACRNLYGGATEKEKKTYEKYKNLHFTYVSDALIKLTKKNLE